MNWRHLFIGSLAISTSLHAQVPGDEHWDVRFGPSGVDGTVLTVLSHGSNVYAGGLFTMAGNANATNVARWDGREWHAVGSGLGIAEGTLLLSYIFALGTDGTHIYAGGQFTNSGSQVFTSSVARWDGTNWEQVGNLRGVPTYLNFVD